MKNVILIIYCAVLCLILICLDKGSLACKWGYKKLHAAACVLSRHIEKYRPDFTDG